jgi:hypothetical protein
MVAGELAGGIGREFTGLGCDPVAALEPSGNRIGVEAATQAVDAGDGAVGGDVLPAIGECGGEEGGALGMAEIGAGLEQVGIAAAAIDDIEVGAAAGQREARNRVGREAVAWRAATTAACVCSSCAGCRLEAMTAKLAGS